MTKKDNLYQVNFRINKKKSPAVIIDFLDAQSNVSNSLRLLLELAVEHFGIIDITTLTHSELNNLLSIMPTQPPHYIQNTALLSPKESTQMQPARETITNKPFIENSYPDDNDNKKIEENISRKSESSSFSAYGFEDD